MICPRYMKDCGKVRKSSSPIKVVELSINDLIAGLNHKHHIAPGAEDFYTIDCSRGDTNRELFPKSIFVIIESKKRRGRWTERDEDKVGFLDESTKTYDSTYTSYVFFLSFVRATAVTECFLVSDLWQEAVGIDDFVLSACLVDEDALGFHNIMQVRRRERGAGGCRSLDGK